MKKENNSCKTNNLARALEHLDKNPKTERIIAKGIFAFCISAGATFAALTFLYVIKQLNL